MRIIPGFRSTRSYLITAAVAAASPDGQPARMAPERIHIVTRPDARLSARARAVALPSRRAQRARLVHGAGIRRRAHAVRRRAPRRQDQHRRPAAGQGAAAFGQQTRLQVYFLPEAVRDLKAPAVSGSLTAAGAGPPAGRFRPGGPHRRQHRRHRARARRNRDAVRRAGVRRRPRRSRRGPGRAPQPHRHQDRHAAQRDSSDHQRGHRAAAGDDRRDRHQPGAALHPGFSSYGSENRSDWYSVLRGFTPRPMWTGCRCPRP